MRKRRGTVVQRSDAWWLRIRTDGARRPWIRLGDLQELRSEAAARRAADAWISRNLPELLSTGASAPAAQYFEAWLRTHAAHLRASTRRRYTTAVRRHLVPELGSMPLARIDVPAIRTALANCRRRCARATVMGIRAVLLQVLRQARIDGFDALEINPRLVRLPATVETEREPRHITAADLARILEACDFPHRAAYAVMGLAGLRCSEALALTWEHVRADAEKPVMHIRQSTQRGELLPLKTKTSRATLPLLPELAAILRDYRAIWRPNAAGLLFATAGGRPWSADALRSRHWAPLLKSLGIPHAGLHSLRHGLPRRLFAAGVSANSVRLLMRHASLRQTEAYTHSTADDLRAAIDRVSNHNRSMHP